MSGVAAQGDSWLTRPERREWLRRGFAGVIRFAMGSIRENGGFHWLDAGGSPLPGRRPMLLLTARVANVSTLEVRHGIPGSGDLLGFEQVVDTLDRQFWDAEAFLVMGRASDDARWPRRRPVVRPSRCRSRPGRDPLCAA